jgi:hypothetical protein
VLALSLDPFTQQVIRFYSQSTVLRGVNATVPRTNFFNETGPHIGAGESAISTPLKNTITAGLFSPQYIIPPVVCPSGNCTFGEVYRSVALCSACDDATNEIQQSCNPNHSVCNYTFPNLRSGSGALVVVNTSASSPLFSADGSSGKLEFLLDYLTIQSALSRNCTKSNTTTCVGAMSCSIWPCIRSYTLDVTGGNITETVIPTSNTDLGTSLNLSQNDDTGTIDLSCVGPAVTEKLISLGYNITAGLTEWINYKGPGLDALGNKTTQNASVPTDCIYGMYPLSSNSIGNWLGTYLQGSIIAEEYESNQFGPAQLAKIYGDGGLTLESLNASMAEIASAASIYIRQNGAAPFSSPAMGQVFSNQTFIHVRWAWLAMPAALVCLTILFFGNILFTVSNMPAYGPGPDWKSSPWPLLYGVVDVGGQSPRELGKMEMLLEDMEARLLWAEGSWRFEKGGTGHR